MELYIIFFSEIVFERVKALVLQEKYTSTATPWFFSLLVICSQNISKAIWMKDVQKVAAGKKWDNLHNPNPLWKWFFVAFLLQAFES